jgi:hypothetical protein
MNSSRHLTEKQQVQLALIHVDADLQHLAASCPQSRSMVDRIRCAVGNIVFLVDGVNIVELCSWGGFEN